MNPKNVTQIIALVVFSGLIAFLAITRSQAATTFYYVGDWIWNSEAESWESPVPNVITSVDLRSLPAQATDGKEVPAICCGLFVLDHVSTVKDLTLLGTADNPESTIEQSIIDGLELRLGIPELASNTLQGIIYELMVVRADPLGQTGPKPVRANSDRVVKFSVGSIAYERPAPDGSIEWQQTLAVEQDFYDKLRVESLEKDDTETYLKALALLADKYNVDYKVFLGDNPDEGTRPPTTSASETWTGCTAGFLDGDLTWQNNFDGTDWACAIVGVDHIALSGNTGVDAMRADVAFSTTDQQVDMVVEDYQLTGNVLSAGVLCRKDSSTTATFYFVVGQVSGPDWRMGKRVSGTSTTLGTWSGTPIDGDIVKMILDGSNIEVYVNGTLRIATTDTAITTGTYCGIHGQSTNAANIVYTDTWNASDFATPTPTPTPTFTPTPTPTNTPTPTPTNTPTVTPTPSSGTPECTATLPFCIDEPVSVDIDWWVFLWPALLVASLTFAEWRKSPIFYFAPLIVCVILVFYIPSTYPIAYAFPTVIALWIAARMRQLVTNTKES